MKKMQLKSMLAAVATVVAMGVAGCSSESENVPEVEPDGTKGGKTETPAELNLTASEIKAADRTAGFQTGYLAEALKASQTDRVVVAPMSAQMQLSIIANVCGPELRAQIVAALGTDDLEAVNSLAYKMANVLPQVDSQVDFTEACSVWATDRHALNGAVASRLGEVFGIAPEVCDFTKAEACALKINGWVNDKTQGMISSIVTPADFNSELLAVLANAEYFKGAWTHPFKAENTKEATFHGTAGTQTASMMNTKLGSTLAYAGDDFSAVILPIGTGSNFTVTLAMAAEGTSLEALAAKDVKCMRQKMDLCTLKLGMPKFKAEGAKMDVNRLVAPLGVTTLRTAETSELFADALPATYDVFQSAVVSFDEQGAEAASVTWSGMDSSSGPEEPAPKEVEITFDRPFLFYITEARTGTILFAGAVRNL